MKRLSFLLAVCLTLTAFSIPASAYEYTFDGPDSGLFGTPTTDNTVYVAARSDTNIDRSKNAALIPPRFGSPTSYTPNAGEYLTPNLVNQPAQLTGTACYTTTGVTIMPPTTVATPSNPFTLADTSSQTSKYTRYTSVTSDLYYGGGHLGTLSVPAIGLTVKVYQGTDNTMLAKGAGHFSDTSVWDGNVAIAAHNRGVNNHFGKIHTLNMGDKITYTTKLGTRSYTVYSVAKISVDDLSVLNDSAENIITLVTCVMDQPQYRWCVKAMEKA